MISLTSSLSLKLYLNSLVYHRNIFGSSSKVFGNLRQSEILGKCSETFVWLLEQFWKIFGNLLKITKNAVISTFTKQKEHNTLARRYEFYVTRGKNNISLSILFLPLEHKIHIFSSPCNIHYISATVRPTVHTNPSQNRSFSIENAHQSRRRVDSKTLKGTN